MAEWFGDDSNRMLFVVARTKERNEKEGYVFCILLMFSFVRISFRHCNIDISLHFQNEEWIVQLKKMLSVVYCGVNLCELHFYCSR